MIFMTCEASEAVSLLPHRLGLLGQETNIVFLYTFFNTFFTSVFSQAFLPQLKEN